jgi:AraC family transcriptional regulator
MIHHHLPSLELESPGVDASPANHVYFSKTSGNHHYPGHETPYLLVANFREAGDYILNNRKTTISDHQFYLLNPGDRLEIDFRKKKELQTFLVAFDKTFISGAFQQANSSPQQLLDDPETAPNASLSVPSVPFFMRGEIAEKLFSVLNARREDEKLAEILTCFFQLLAETQHRMENLKAVKRSTREEIYRRLFLSEAFIREHLKEDVSLDQMAAACCMNPFHFLKLFKELFHTTPHQYLTVLRLEKARDLLKSGYISVTDTCYSVGFGSPASFSHLFKKRWGCSPSELQVR